MKIVHKCGHTGYSSVFGTEEAIAKRVTELENGDCTDCWLRKQPPGFLIKPLGAAGVVVVASYCYTIREELSARGYYFTQRAWRKKLTTQAQEEAERLWITERGFSIAEYVKRKRPVKKKTLKVRAKRLGL